MKRTMSIVSMIFVMLMGSIFVPNVASANITTGGTINLTCGSAWSKTDTSTTFSIQVTCKTTATTFAYSWKGRYPDWTQRSSYDTGMKWQRSNNTGGGGKTYDIGLNYTVHGSYTMPNNTSVHMEDSAVMYNLELGSINAVVLADFRMGYSPCLGKSSGTPCPSAIAPA